MGSVGKARLTISEISEAVESGRLKIDGEVIRPTGEVMVTKAAVDPVWDLPGHRAALRRD